MELFVQIFGNPNKHTGGVKTLYMKSGIRSPHSCLEYGIEKLSKLESLAFSRNFWLFLWSVTRDFEDTSFFYICHDLDPFYLQILSAGMWKWFPQSIFIKLAYQIFFTRISNFWYLVVMKLITLFETNSSQNVFH